MKMLCKQVVFLVCCLVVYGNYFVPKPKGSDLEIPESLEKLEKTFPQGSDWMRLVRAERTIAKHEALQIIFHDLPRNAGEVVLETSIFLYLPHRENAPTTNYKVHIRDLFTGRLITYKFLPIQNTGWHKVLLNHWPDDRGLGLQSANHGLEIRLRQNGGEDFDFEEFCKNENFNRKFLPSLLIYYENKKPQSLRDFFNVSEFENLDKQHSDMPVNPRRPKRHTSNSSCHYVTHDVYTYYKLSAINHFYYHPNTTVECTGRCTSPKAAALPGGSINTYGSSTPPTATPPTGNSSNTKSVQSNVMMSQCNETVEDCCVPSKQQPLIMLLLDENSTLVLRSFPDTIVEECACASSLGSVTGTANNG